jgi:tritrans,polycis-undecaprenyl-diphosphate synthase [geranylgeranyl-diphosphate specific]
VNDIKYGRCLLLLQRLLSAIGVYKLYRAWLRRQIDSERLPEHIGVILDGNRRWASARNLIPWLGHREGAAKVREFLEWCLNLGIKTITLYAFSTENFSRSKKEVEELMRIYEENLSELIDSKVIHDHQVRVSVIGRKILPEHSTRLRRESGDRRRSETDHRQSQGRRTRCR